MKLEQLNQYLKSHGLTILTAVSVFAIGLIIYILPIALFPDYLNLREYSKIYELFNLIISSLTSLIGIYITVSLVAYEFFKQKSGIDFQKSFLVNRTNALFISFSVSTIICAFISSLVIHSEKPNYNEVSIIYYNSFLFLLVICFLFPVAFNLFSSLKPGKLASEEIEKINSKTIFIHWGNEEDIDKQVEFMENDHLVKVQNMVIALISVSDKIKAQAIIFKCTKKLGTLIIETKIENEKKHIINRLINFYINIIDFTLLQPNNSAILNTIWASIEMMYQLLIQKKAYAHNFKEFRNGFIERYFNRLIENNKEEIIFNGIESLRNIIYNQMVSNMPSDEELYDLNHLRAQFEKKFKYPTEFEDEAHHKSEHFGEIAIEFLSCFSFIMDKAIKHKKPELLNKCAEELIKLNSEIERADNSGKYKQCFLYIKCSQMISDFAYTAFKENIYTTNSEAKGLLPILLEHDIQEGKLYARTVLQKYCYLLIDLQALNKLDRWFLGGLDFGGIIWEGDLGKIARRCVFNLKKNELVYKCLQDIIETYSILKGDFEKSENKRFDLYSMVKFRLQTISELLTEHTEGNENLIESLDNLLSSFKSLEEFEK